MATTRLPPDFREFLRLLTANGVKYLVVGGYAVSYHGYARATAHMDIWVAADQANAEKLVVALKEFGFDVPELSPDLFPQPDMVIRLGEPPLRIELLTDLPGLTFEVAFPRRVVDNIDGVEVSLISLVDLKTNKKAAGRHKHLA
ncbi:MAG: nucleotidyltransferase [Armatimonadetes bacterium]|nr:nucleotidyltransferase [Armatimonadota bacterium]